ncbi:MAG: hypothetical protein K2P52_07680, partial [Campylobacterales bacterium]|nr:hypothetical protein [Campylobacterales bacterium]
AAHGGRVYRCAILWFKDHNIDWQDKAIIWINAKTAFYDTMNVTPMAYGFGAHELKEDIQAGLEIINYEEIKKRILETKK